MRITKNKISIWLLIKNYFSINWIKKNYYDILTFFAEKMYENPLWAHAVILYIWSNFGVKFLLLKKILCQTCPNVAFGDLLACLIEILDQIWYTTLRRSNEVLGIFFRVRIFSHNRSIDWAANIIFPNLLISMNCLLMIFCILKKIFEGK
jgi:hypothetical protein